eukprot:s8534_g1.t1
MSLGHAGRQFSKPGRRSAPSPGGLPLSARPWTAEGVKASDVSTRPSTATEENWACFGCCPSSQAAALAAVLAAGPARELECWVVPPPARQTVALNREKSSGTNADADSPVSQDQPIRRTLSFVDLSLQEIEKAILTEDPEWDFQARLLNLLLFMFPQEVSLLER